MPACGRAGKQASHCCRHLCSCSRQHGSLATDQTQASSLPPSPPSPVQGPPECCSYTFNEQGLVTSFTGGYVMDNRVGNTGVWLYVCAAGEWETEGCVGSVGSPGGLLHGCMGSSVGRAATGVSGRVQCFPACCINAAPHSLPSCACPAAADGLGVAFGILSACGVKIPKVNSLQWEVAVNLNKVLTALDKAFGKKE